MKLSDAIIRGTKMFPKKVMSTSWAWINNRIVATDVIGAAVAGMSGDICLNIQVRNKYQLWKILNPLKDNLYDEYPGPWNHYVRERPCMCGRHCSDLRTDDESEYNLIDIIDFLSYHDNVSREDVAYWLYCYNL